ETFIQSAETNPNREFTLVIDVTFDPNYTPPALPSNVTLIRTCSLTKHARGERNFFFGSIAINGQNKNKDMSTEILESNCNLTADNVVHLPRITHSEVARKQEKIHTLQTVFVKTFEQCQQDIVPEMRWHVFRNPYCLYFEPPLARAVAEGQQASDRFIERLCPNQTTNISNVENPFTLEFNNSTTSFNCRDLVEKVQTMRKKVEDQLGISGTLNEDELKHEVLLEKVRVMAEDEPENVAALLQALLSEEADIPHHRQQG
ncbi:MAG: hypothetical protein P8Y16_04835, partial [Sulfurimonas sp.]